MFMFNVLLSFYFVQITFMYFPYLFLIQSSGPPCLQINALDAYDLQFRRSLYIWKDKEIILPMQWVSWLNEIRITRSH
jgi:hypothetical protein